MCVLSTKGTIRKKSGNLFNDPRNSTKSVSSNFFAHTPSMIRRILRTCEYIEWEIPSLAHGSSDSIISPHIVMQVWIQVHVFETGLQRKKQARKKNLNRCYLTKLGWTWHFKKCQCVESSLSLRRRLAKFPELKRRLAATFSNLTSLLSSANLLADLCLPVPTLLLGWNFLASGFLATHWLTI